MPSLVKNTLDGAQSRQAKPTLCMSHRFDLSNPKMKNSLDNFLDFSLANFLRHFIFA